MAAVTDLLETPERWFSWASGIAKRTRGELAPVLTAVLFVVPVVAAALFYVWTQVATLQLGYALSKASRHHEASLEQNRALRIEVAALKAPERLERMAKQFKLAPPRPEQIIQVGKK